MLLYTGSNIIETSNVTWFQVLRDRIIVHFIGGDELELLKGEYGRVKEWLALDETKESRPEQKQLS